MEITRIQRTKWPEVLNVWIKSTPESELMPFTLTHNDLAPASIAVREWFENNQDKWPEVEPAETLDLDSIIKNTALTPRQFRMALIKSGISPAKLLTDLHEKANATMGMAIDEIHTHFEYSTIFRFDDPLTQDILKFAGLSEDAARKMWELGITLEA